MRAVLLLVAVLGGPGCLVLSVHPAYDGDGTFAWEPTLVGEWHDADDNVTVRIDEDEWRSYRVHYTHPIETGELTAYMTAIGDARYLDLMPARGADRGAFLLPVHAVVRVELAGDRLEVTPLSYDWFFDRLRTGARIPGLTAVRDQKENALIASPPAAVRDWLRRQPPSGRMFGAPAVFQRKPETRDQGSAIKD